VTRKIIAVIWLSPVAIPIWLLYLLPAWGLGLIRLKEKRRWGVVFGPGKRWHLWAWMWSGWVGHAMPFAAVIKRPDWDDAYPRIVDHEMRHCRQWVALGALFPIAYGLLTLVFGYRDNPFEVDARAVEFP
jgi:hypothetical protein